MHKKLTRNTNNKIIAGVLSGLADYFGHDVTLYRLLAIVGLILTGFFPGVVLYAVAWIMMPASSKAPDAPTAHYEVNE